MCDDIRARMSAIARLPRKPQTPEHRARIGEGVRRALTEGRSGWRHTHAMTPEERCDYTALRAADYRMAEALEAIGRSDLIPANRR